MKSIASLLFVVTILGGCSRVVSIDNEKYERLFKECLDKLPKTVVDLGDAVKECRWTAKEMAATYK